MGFCIFNNIGVAAAYALEVKGLERVAIVDFDVHHGNGTEDMFSAPKWRDRVLMASFFQHPFYPAQRYGQSGAQHDQRAARRRQRRCGGAAGDGAVLARPRSRAFKPQMILISAGFDAHREDLLGGLALVEDDYAWLTRELMAVAERTRRTAHGLDARRRLQPAGARAQRGGACQDC